MHTDGMNEAMDASDRAFGRARALTLMRRIRRESPREIIDTLMASVSSFSSPAPPADDLTALVVKFPASANCDDAEVTVVSNEQPRAIARREVTEADLPASPVY